MSDSACPQCGKAATQLVKIETGMKVTLEDLGEKSTIAEVCADCFKNLQSKISYGSKVRAQQKAQDNKRMSLWKSRVNILKRARALMEAKAYSQAAGAYEKYVRVIEMAYDVKPGELNPETFKSSGRQQELTVLTSVYWDLFRIYDAIPSYSERQNKAADKLIAYAPLTPIHNNIVSNSKTFQKSGNNSTAIRRLTKGLNASGGRCFVATVAYEDGLHPDVIYLRKFRDQYLLTHSLGKLFVAIYYFLSPYVAQSLRHIQFARVLMRIGLRILCRSLRFLGFNPKLNLEVFPNEN